MAEFQIYPESQKLYDELTQGKRKDYVLTMRIPLGVRVDMAPPKDDRNWLQKIFSKRKYEKVVCIGPTDKGRPLLAVHLDLVSKLDTLI